MDESTLIIPEVEEEDEGIYTCEVLTNLDVVEASGSITIVGTTRCNLWNNVCSLWQDHLQTIYLWELIYNARE